MAIFKVLQPIERDGRKLKVGDSIELPTEEATSLLSLKAIEPTQGSVSPVIIEQTTMTAKTAKVEPSKV